MENMDTQVARRLRSPFPAFPFIVPTYLARRARRGSPPNKKKHKRTYASELQIRIVPILICTLYKVKLSNNFFDNEMITKLSPFRPSRLRHPGLA